MTGSSCTSFDDQEMLMHRNGGALIEPSVLQSNTESIRLAKDELVNLVSASLMSETDFFSSFPCDDKNSVKRRNTSRIAELVHSISAVDGEFVLKLSLYVRRDLNIRLTAAFLVALCAYERRCQPFIACYMKRIVLLPSDWLNIANIAHRKPLSYLLANDGSRRGIEGGDAAGCCLVQRIKGIPNSLRRALALTFAMFDEFSLAKYNTERAMKRSMLRVTAERRGRYFYGEESLVVTQSDRSIPSRLTFKHLIRQLHLSRPAYAVNCILGKRYPDTVDEFLKRGLDEGGTRTFDAALRGQRMRLTPVETWERCISHDGNKAQVWDKLVANKCLPFMAAMRNLRNIVLCGCSPDTHEKLVKCFTSEEEVLNSRQCPYRFLTAYKALDFDSDKALKDFYDPHWLRASRHRPFHAKVVDKRFRRRRGTRPSSATVEASKNMYREAIQRAAEISARLNIMPVSGRSLVILNVTDFLLSSRKVDEQLNSVFQVAVSFKYACEDCCIILLYCDLFQVVDSEIRREDGIFSNVEKVNRICCELLERRKCQSASMDETQHWCVRDDNVVFPYSYLDGLIEKRLNLQALVVVGWRHDCYSGQNRIPSLGDLPVYLDRLRRTCNEHMLFVSLSFLGRHNTERSVQLRYQHRNDVLLTGFSDAVLRIVAEGVSCGPRRYIERVHEVYDVPMATIRYTRQKLEGDLRALREIHGIRDYGDVKTTECSVGGVSSGAFSRMFRDSAQGAAPSTSNEGVTVPLHSAGSLWSRYQTFRFFLSSTFLDMVNERNALVLDVFPKLRRWAAENNLHVNIIEVDLRWGITEDSTKANLSPSVCLNEVSRCAPFFLGVLGSRYGYCPPTFFHSVDDGVDATDFSWLKQYEEQHGCDNCMSVTEMEMRHAIFTARRRTKESDPPTMAFLVRDSTTLIQSLPVCHRQTYGPDTATATASIERLIEYLKAQRAVVLPYTAVYKQPSTNDYFPHSSSSLLFLPTGDTGFSASRGVAMPTKECQLDMSDFSRKAFVALRSIILRHLNLPLVTDSGTGGVIHPQRHYCSEGTKSDLAGTSDYGETLYTRECMNQLSFSSGLLKKFIPFRGLMDVLVHFGCTGHFRAKNEGESSARSLPADVCTSGTALGTGHAEKGTNVLILRAREGDGGSTAAAALAMHLRKMNSTHIVVTHFACQAGDGSLRHLAYYIAFSIVYGVGLQEDFRVQEADTVATLVQLLPRVYAAAAKKRNICVILDGMNRSLHEGDMLHNLNWIVPPEPIHGVRFVVTLTAGNNSFLSAFMLRTPPPFCVMLPDFTSTEQAELVRKHLSFSGKRLQESFHANQLKSLLRKSEAGHASYLTYAIMYLRLFSTFDTLTEDIAQLPSTLAQLQVVTFDRLEERFGNTICRAVLVALYISIDVGGLNEFTLYRLVSDVAGASRLVVLLDGTCLRISKRRISISSTSFASSIASRYLSRASDLVDASLNILVSELYYRPLSLHTSRHELRRCVQRIVDDIKRDSGEKPVFDPRRYTAGELLSMLHFAKRAKEYDALVALLLYVPLLENLVVSAGYLQRFISILSQSACLGTIFARRLSPVVDFLQRKYYILAHHPSQLRQCISNMAGGAAVFLGLSHCTREATTGCASRMRNMWVKWINNTHCVEEGKLVMFPLISPVKCLAINCDGEFIAGCGDDMAAYVVPLASPDQVTAPLKHRGTVTSVTFLAHREHILVTGSGTGVICVWNVEDGRMLQQGCGFHRRCVSSLVAHPVADAVCSGSTDGSCAFWSVTGNTTMTNVCSGLAPTEVLQHHQAPISSIAYHISGSILATGSWEGKVYFIDVQQHLDCPSEFGGDTDATAPLGEENSEKVVRTTRYRELPYSHFVFETVSPVRALAFVPSMVVTCAVGLSSGDICLYDYTSASCCARFTFHAGVPITALIFSPDAKWMASGDEEGRVLVTYAGVRGTLLCSLNGHQGGVSAIRFHPRNSLNLYTTSLDGTVKSWLIGRSEDVSAHVGALSTDAGEAAMLRAKHTVTVTACAAASDGSFFVTAAADGVALLFTRRKDLKNAVGCCKPTNTEMVPFESHFTLRHDHHRVTYILIGLGNKRVLCGTANGEVFVWDSVPGLNRREGRLLQRIRVAEEGIHPVIYIGCKHQQVQAQCGGDTGATQLIDPFCMRITAITSSATVAVWMVSGDDNFSACADTTRLPLEEQHAREGGPQPHAGGDDPTVSEDKLLQRSALYWVGQAEELRSLEEQRALVDGGSFTGSDAENVPLNGAEEIVAVVPLLQTGCLSGLEGADMGTRERGNEAEACKVAEGLLGDSLWMRDTTTCRFGEYYIVVGRSHCHLLSIQLRSVIQLPFFAAQKGCVDRSEDVFNSVVCLSKGDAFLCASNAMCVKEYVEGDGELNTVFAASSSGCVVWLFEVTFGPPATSAKGVSVPCGVKSNKVLMEEFSKNARITALLCAPITGLHGIPVPVDTLHLSFVSPTGAEGSHNRAQEETDCSEGLSTLLLTAGCRDGAMKVFAIRPCQPRSMKTHGGECSPEGDGRNNGREASGAAVRTGQGYCVKRGVLLDECGAFFATSGVTAVATVRILATTQQSGTTFSCPGLLDAALRKSGGTHGWFGSSSSSVLHVAGDHLGNVYQLQLRGDKAEDASASATGARGFYSASRWSLPGTEVTSPRTVSNRRMATGCTIKQSQLFSGGECREKDTSDCVTAVDAMSDDDAWQLESRRIVAMFAPCVITADSPGEVSEGQTDRPMTVIGNQFPEEGQVVELPPFEKILQNASPSLSSEERREWYRERQNLLVEAIRVQRVAARAREVLTEYSKNVLTEMGLWEQRSDV